MRRRLNAIVSVHSHPHVPFPFAALTSSHRLMQLAVETGLHSLPWQYQRVNRQHHIRQGGGFLQLSHLPVRRVLPM